jgi:transposase
MIEPDKRNAIYQMHLAGMSARQISQRMGVSRSTVKILIGQQGQMPQIARKDRIDVDPDLLRRLYEECGGWKQRIHERLVEEEKIAISYPTLTRLLRKLGIGRERNVRCDAVPDEPGLEMQHDTTVYTVPLGGQRTKLIASLVYLRYSKRRYLKFYRVFHRFAMKCFLHEALMFWGYAPKQCVIDNTNLARWLGSGARAVIAPEMVSFGKQYGFSFLCHELGHCNRKENTSRYTSLATRRATFHWRPSIG